MKVSRKELEEYMFTQLVSFGFTPKDHEVRLIVWVVEKFINEKKGAEGHESAGT